MQIDPTKDREARRARAKIAAAPEVARLSARTEAEVRRDVLRAKLVGVGFKSGGELEVLLPELGDDGRWAYYVRDLGEGVDYRLWIRTGPRGGRTYRMEPRRG